MEKVFVYGTLRRGEMNHGLLDSCSLISQVALAKGSLVDTGLGYPAMLSSIYEVVTGELYEVNIEVLLRLDRLEGFYEPGDLRNHYERTRIEVQTDKGVTEAWVYICQKYNQENKIPSGDWRLHYMCQQKNIHYFAYGSCMDTVRMEEAGVANWFTQVEGRGILYGFNLQFTRKTPDGGRADVVETGGHTEGKLYRIPEHALEGYLYGREGVKNGTCRPVIVPIQCKHGNMVDAITFVVAKKEQEVTPPDWYMKEILQGALPIVSEDYYLSLVDRFVSVFGFQLNEEELM